jgi:hypothetical protein
VDRDMCTELTDLINSRRKLLNVNVSSRPERLLASY